MARTKNAKNKPKFGAIKLSLLCGYLKEDSLIPVDIKFLNAIKSVNEAISFDEISNAEFQNQETEEKIEMIIN